MLNAVYIHNLCSESHIDWSSRWLQLEIAAMLKTTQNSTLLLPRMPPKRWTLDFVVNRLRKNLAIRSLEQNLKLISRFAKGKRWHSWTGFGRVSFKVCYFPTYSWPCPRGLMDKASPSGIKSCERRRLRVRVPSRTWFSTIARWFFFCDDHVFLKWTLIREVKEWVKMPSRASRYLRCVCSFKFGIRIFEIGREWVDNTEYIVASGAKKHIAICSRSVLIYSHLIFFFLY